MVLLVILIGMHPKS